MMMCLCVFLFGSNFFGTLWASLTFWESISFTRLGKFSFIICSSVFSISCCCSSPSGTHVIQILERFRLSQRFVRLSSLFWILIFSFFSGWMFIFFLLFQIVPLSPRFPSCHCWFPEYFVLFHFGYPSFVFSFFDQAQSDLWAFWLPGLWIFHQIGWQSPHRLALSLSFALFFHLGHISLSWNSW